MSDKLTDHWHDGTWESLERAARNDAAIYHAVTLIKTGMPREQVLIGLVLWLAESRKLLIDAEVERLRNELPKTRIFEVPGASER
jgi:hypothetical protein